MSLEKTVVFLLVTVGGVGGLPALQGEANDGAEEDYKYYYPRQTILQVSLFCLVNI